MCNKRALFFSSPPLPAAILFLFRLRLLSPTSSTLAMLLSLFTIVHTLLLTAALPAQQITPPVCSPASSESSSRQETLSVEPIASAATVQTSASDDDCCGFVVTDRNNAYFRHRSIVDFSSMTSIAEINAAGWSVSDGWQAGGESDKGQSPIANKQNVKIVKGKGLSMTVPGKQDHRCYTHPIFLPTSAQPLISPPSET